MSSLGGDALRGQAQKKNELSPDALAILRFVGGIIFLIIECWDGLTLWNFPGTLLLLSGIVVKLMSQLHGVKRKRDEDETLEIESETEVKRHRSNSNAALLDVSELDEDDAAQDNSNDLEDHEHHEHGACGCCASDEDDEEDDDMENFRPVLAIITLEKIPKLASKLRHEHDTKNSGISPELIDCVVHETPESGSWNLFYLIEFADGVKWGLRVPAIGTDEKFDDLAARAMENDILTMRFLKRTTTIPVPTIYGYNLSTSTENELNCPYIMMEFIEGTLLLEKWFDKSLSEAELEKVRARALQDLAKAMIQLGQFRYDQGGALRFDDGGNPIGVGSMRILNDLDMFSAGYCSVHELGPFSDPVATLTKKLDVNTKDDAEKDSENMVVAFRNLLRLLLTWIPQGPDPKFVLHHPDFNTQNIIVADDGSLLAIIDWDGVCTEPIFIGNECYPIFLTRDLDAEGYLAGGEVEKEEEADQNTPEELERYRAVYLECIKACKVQAETSDTDPSVSITKNSALTYSLAQAVIPEFTDQILLRIFGQLREAVADDPRCPVSEHEKNLIAIGKVPEQSKVDFHLMLEIGKAITAGTLSEERMGWLRDGFALLWS